MTRWTTIVFVMAALTGPVAAQEVWRCGPDGRHFQAVPCAGGRPMALEAGPSAAAVQEARDVAQREREALAALAEERRAREREALAGPRGPAGIKPAPRLPEAPARPAKKKAPETLPAWRPWPAA